MQTAILKPQILILSDVRINFGLIPIKDKDRDYETIQNQLTLFKTLPEKGLDRLTTAKVEQILCTSALCAHI